MLVVQSRRDPNAQQQQVACAWLPSGHRQGHRHAGREARIDCSRPSRRPGRARVNRWPVKWPYAKYVFDIFRTVLSLIKVPPTALLDKWENVLVGKHPLGDSNEQWQLGKKWDPKNERERRSAKRTRALTWADKLWNKSRSNETSQHNLNTCNKTARENHSSHKEKGT